MKATLYAKLFILFPFEIYCIHYVILSIVKVHFYFFILKLKKNKFLNLLRMFMVNLLVASQYHRHTTKKTALSQIWLTLKISQYLHHSCVKIFEDYKIINELAYVQCESYESSDANKIRQVVFLAFFFQVLRKK